MALSGFGKRHLLFLSYLIIYLAGVCVYIEKYCKLNFVELLHSKSHICNIFLFKSNKVIYLACQKL